MKHPQDEKAHKDPVCGMLGSRLTAAADASHEGKTYYFCAPECRDAFVAEPGKFLLQHRQHGLRPNKSDGMSLAPDLGKRKDVST